MYKLDKNTYETYKEFFFFGIDSNGEKELYEAIIFFTYFNEIRNQYLNQEVTKKKNIWKEQYEIKNKILTAQEILEKTIQRARKIAIQYYRFVVLNNTPKILINYDKSKRKEQEDDIEKSLKNILEEKIKDGSIKIEDNKISISKNWIMKYIHYPEYSVKENMQDYIIRNWTEEVFDILRYLEDIEKSNSKGYYDIWLKTRIKRLENKDRNKNNEEIGKLKLIVDKLKTIKNIQKKDIYKNPILRVFEENEIEL